MAVSRPSTWRELDTRSTQLAHVFAREGLGLGDRLAVSLPNSLDHLLAGFAGWKVGATVVPVRWDLPGVGAWPRPRSARPRSWLSAPISWT